MRLFSSNMLIFLGKKCYTEKVSVGAANEKYDDEESNMDAVEACEEPEVQDTKGRKEIKKNSRSTLTHGTLNN